MKFSHSERTLHPESLYTPASNYYRQQKDTHKVLTGSLMGPSLPKQQPNFGLSTRFSGKKDKAPGPGAYFQEKPKESSKKHLETSAVIRQYKKHGFLGGEVRTPSIPYAYFNPDEEDEQYIREILINEDLNRSALATKKNHQGHTFSRSPRKIEQSNPPKKNLESQLEAIAEYSQKMKFLGMKSKIQENKQQIKRANQRRAEIINKMNPEFVPSLQLVQIITKRRTKYTPGPGFYQQQDMRQIQNGIGTTFTTSKRFSEDKGSLTGPGRYQVQEQRKKTISFSKSARTLFNMKEDTDLEHRFYIDPYSNVKKRQVDNVRGKNDVFSFGSQVARFNIIQKQAPLPIQSAKEKRKSKIEAVVESRLKKMHALDKRHTAQSQGLLGISTMASTID